MKCSDVRSFLAQITDKSVSMQLLQADIDFLCANGYLSMMQKAAYDQAAAEVSNLAQMNEQLQVEMNQEKGDAAALDGDQRKTHSILFHFEGKDKKEAELQKEESEKSTVSKEEAEIAERDAQIAQLIQKKSALDRVVQYSGGYLSLTDLGVLTLNDLNMSNYRVSDSQFSDFIEEGRETSRELQAIAQRGDYFVSGFKAGIPKADPAQLWSVSIGLAKLQGDQAQISERFLLALALLKNFTSTIDNKLMAAEVMTSFPATNTQLSSDNSDLQASSVTLVNLDKEIRRDAKVPKKLSAGVAATIMAGRKFDGTYPTDRFLQFSRLTRSYESAAILSVMNVPSDQLSGSFEAFRSLFSSWGYQTSEDTELASAYLAISDFGSEDVKTKLSIIVDGLKNYLEYPLVAGAILTSIPTLEANETLYLMEKAYSVLAPVAAGLGRPELVTLSVRMIHGIRNELVKQLDPTAKIANTPVQFTHSPSFVFFPFYGPVIVAHSAYFATFSGIGGVHPAHVHAVGGFAG